MVNLLFVIMDDPSSLSESVRAAHAFHYAVSLKRSGNRVLIYLDGLGVKIPVSESPYRGLKPAYEEAVREGLLLGACGYCASPPHLNLREKLKVKLIGDEDHHYAFEDLLSEGFQLIMA
jgi:predicted peroxiredoxin